jgi:hypothetical protein
MKTVLSAVLLILIACESVDAPRDAKRKQPVVDSHLQLLPLKDDGPGPFIEITIPTPTGLTPALVPPITTFQWQTAEGAEDPDSVRWILKDVEGNDFAGTIAYLRDHFDEAPWSPWHAYDPDTDTGTSWTTPATDFGSYILAVHGKEDGVVNRVLDERLNVRRIRVSQRSTGPLLTLTSNVTDPILTAVVNTPPTIVNLPGGVPIEFCWTADATEYGGVVRSHRYGWDLVDPDDDSQWDVVASYDGSEYCPEPSTLFFGTHTFYVEAFDNSGYSSRIPVRINFTPPDHVLALDVRPGSCPNPLNPKSRGVLWVALPGSDSFDVNEVDLATLSLGGLPGQRGPTPLMRSMIHDVTSPAAGDGECTCPDRGPDGFDDLNLKFSLRELEFESAGHDAQLTLFGNTTAGESFAATDCVRIVGVQDEDEEEPDPSGPDTEIYMVWNTYRMGGRIVTESVDVSDALPDTVPYGSWITVFYDGTPDPATASMCPDPTDPNQCIGYQKSYTSRSANVPGFQESAPWMPFSSPEDNDPFARSDSTSLNMGSVDYTVRIRSVDYFGGVDTSPAEVAIVGNHAPTLDGVEVQDSDGAATADIVWDWWNPANFHGSRSDTLDITDLPNIWVVREFYFLVKGEGHDHPTERDRGGVKAWRYLFRRSDDPSTTVPLGRAGLWVEGSETDALCDTVRFTVRYSFYDDPGGWKAWAALPDWFGHSYDVTLRGRDTGLFERDFRQFMFVDGDKRLINSYPVASLGRYTEERSARIHLSITRGDMPAQTASGAARTRLMRR